MPDLPKRLKDPRGLAYTLDYVGFLCTIALAVVSVIALYYGNDTVAGAAVGGIAGYMTRSSKS